MNVLVLKGGMSTERDVSLNTGRAVAGALRQAGHSVAEYDLDHGSGRGVLALAASDGFAEADVVFIALHGGEGEDGRIQALLELLGMPYTGSGVRASSMAMDKAVSKILFERIGIPTPPWAFLKGPEACAGAAEAVDRLGGLPVVVKPVDQGSTIGVSIVSASGRLQPAIDLALSYSAGVILERYIAGRELSVPIVGDEVFPVVEIRPKSGFYDYERKYTKGLTLYDCPARIGDRLTRSIQADALRAYHGLGCEGFGRVDLRLGEDEAPYFLEVNTIPGMTETSLVPMAARAKGLSFPALVDRIVSLAMERTDTPKPKYGG